MKNTNSLRDEVRIQREKLSQEPLSKKLEYYWYYYKIHVMITVFAACMFGSILHGVMTKKETILSVAFINAFPNVEDEVMMEDLSNYLGLNQKKQQVFLDSTYYIDEASASPYAATYSQKFSTNAMAGKLDVVLADVVNFDYYATNGFFQDLSPFLSEQDLSHYSNRLYYVDLPYDESNDLVPIGIKIDHVSKIQETACYPGTAAYYGILTNAEHVDMALSYLEYIEQ